MIRDIGISTLVQVTLARTPRGFVPNWKSGAHSSYDRTENQVGAFIALRIVNMLPPETKSWIANLLVPVFISWHQWVWTSRMARGGVFNGSPLMIIGSDPSLPHDNGDGTMQGARYESMDNSACYDAPPISFNSFFSLRKSGQLSKNNIEDAKQEQRKILQELNMIKQNLDGLIESTS